MNNQFLINYRLGNGVFDRLTGRSKLIFFLSSIMLMMVSFDLRLIGPFFVVYLGLFLKVYRPSSSIRFAIRFVVLMNVINFALFYLVNPTIGTDLAGRATLIGQLNDQYPLMLETLIYMLTRLLKIMGTLLISLWFILIITPSQLASGLSKIGVPYKIGTMCALGFRYIPDIHRHFVDIRDSMQMRGLELHPKKSSLWKRLKANVTILLPLILVSFERVELIASAMDLRGYGQGKKRTYYSEVDATPLDTWMQLIGYGQMILTIVYLLCLYQGYVPTLWVG